MLRGKRRKDTNGEFYIVGRDAVDLDTDGRIPIRAVDNAIGDLIYCMYIGFDHTTILNEMSY